MKARVFVRPKPSVFDPQGTTVRRALEGLGYREVSDLRIGKVLELTLEDSDPAQVSIRLEEMCRKLLANPVIEEYSWEIEGLVSRGEWR